MSQTIKISIILLLLPAILFLFIMLNLRITAIKKINPKCSNMPIFIYKKTAQIEIA